MDSAERTPCQCPGGAQCRWHGDSLCPTCGGPMIPVQGGGGMICPRC